MKKSIERTAKYHVNPMGSVSRHCSWCESLQLVNTDPCRKGVGTVNIRCSCGEIFQVELDSTVN